MITKMQLLIFIEYGKKTLLLEIISIFGIFSISAFRRFSTAKTQIQYQTLVSGPKCSQCIL